MESNKNLVFIGMMGSGKTTLGKIVSKKLNMKFIDIDHEIESKENMKISDLFKKKGEVFFRKLEERISLQNLKKNNSVISLGGGAFINKKVQKEVLKNHISIWLKWDNQNLINRIKNSQKRPIAFNASKNELIELIKKRSIVYSKAMYKVDCEKLTKNEIVDIILKIYEAH